MSAVYEQIGRLVVRVVWWRFATQIKVAGALALLGIGACGYIAATREPPEG